MGQGAGKMADRFDKPSHAKGLDQAEAGDQQAFGRDVRPRGKTRAQFLFQDVPFLGDFARSVIGSHEREQNDLEHGQAGNEQRGAEGILHAFQFGDAALDDVELGPVLEEIGRGHRMDLGQAGQGKDHDQEGKGDQERQVQPELALVPGQQDVLTPQQRKKLAQAAGRRRRVQGTGIGWRG